MATSAINRDSPVYIWTLRLLSVLTFVAALLVAAVNVWVLVVIVPHTNTLDSVTQIIVRLYNTFMCGLILIATFDFDFLAKWMFFLCTNFGAGGFYIFTGILTLGSTCALPAFDAGASKWSHASDLVRKVSGLLLVAIGFLYTTMGLFAFPYLHKRERFLNFHKQLHNSVSSLDMTKHVIV